jgi:ATP-binding cassette, subfamily B, bacterial PglK
VKRPETYRQCVPAAVSVTVYNCRTSHGLSVFRTCTLPFLGILLSTDTRQDRARFVPAWKNPGKMLQGLYNILFRDLVRAYRVLPSELRRGILALFGMMVLLAFIELATVVTLTYVAQSIGDPESVRGNVVYRSLFAVVPGLQEWSADHRRFLLLTTLVAVIAVLLKNLVAMLTTLRTGYVGENIARSVGLELMDRFLYADYTWHLSNESTSMFQRMLWRGNLGQMMIWLLLMHSGLIAVAVLFAGLIWQAPVPSLAVLAVTGSTGALVYRLVRSSVDKAAAVAAEGNTDENKVVLAATRGIREVLIYGQQPAFLNAVAKAIDKSIPARVFVSMSNPLPSWVLEVVGFALVSAAVALLIHVWDTPMAGITEVVALLTLTAWRVLPYLNRTVGYMVGIRGIRPSAMPVVELLETLRSHRREPPPAPDPNFRFEHDIQLENLYFRYPESSKDSLADLTLTIPKGAQIGLVGQSGAGKSTLAAVLSGLMAPTSGRILVDGEPLTPSRSVAYRSRVGYVPQNPFFMKGTLAENVAFSQWGRPWEEERVLQACRMAAVDFLHEHPEGVNLPIGENGSGLSGGQAQRVSIARVLYARPSIVIFDEATSALDQSNENIIQTTINHLRGEVTSIIIAHRLSTLEHCDVIYWLDDGRLVAQGSSSQILPQYVARHKQGVDTTESFPSENGTRL